MVQHQKQLTMPTGFLDLPSELRNIIYELCLRHEKPFVPYLDDREHQSFALALLCTNKAIHAEASAVFYCQNRFAFTLIPSSDRATSEDVALVYDKIGPTNADYIQHIYVNFPSLDTSLAFITVARIDFDMFETLQSCCPNIKTITTPVVSYSNLECQLHSLYSTTFIPTALRVVDDLWRTNLAIQEVTVNVWNDEPNHFDDPIYKQMWNLGWTLTLDEVMERIS